MPDRALGSFASGVLAVALALAALGCDRSERAAPTSSPGAGPVGPRVSEILRGKEPLERVRELSALLPTLAPDALPALLEAFDSAPLGDGDPELQLFAIWWARFDPGAAHLWTLSEWRARSGAVVAAVFRSWAHVDPAQALDAARKHPVAGLGDFAIEAAIAGWDESGRPGLVDALIQLADREQQYLAEILARRRVATLGPAGAFEWLASLSGTPRFQQTMEPRIASSAAAAVGGGPIAAAWATPRVRSDDRLSSLPRRIATRWVVRDPEAAMKWLASLPAGADRVDGVIDGFRTWLMRDGPAARAWIERVELEPWNEPALAVYAKSLAHAEPQHALELAQRIGDVEIREATLIHVGQVWAKTDQPAVQAWLAQADVSQHVREQAAVSGNEARKRRRAMVEQRQRELQEQQGAQPEARAE